MGGLSGWFCFEVDIVSPFHLCISVLDLVKVPFKAFETYRPLI